MDGLTNNAPVMSTHRDSKHLEPQRRVSSVWKSYLYQVQQEAPKPHAVTCPERPPSCPPFYGAEYHGALDKERCPSLLPRDGAYLVRSSRRAEGCYTLSMCFNGQVKHYRLYYDGQHYVGEKRFHTLGQLVADGLVTLYMEQRAGDHLRNMSAAKYLNSPHYTLTRSIRNHMRTAKLGSLNKENSEPVCLKDAPAEVASSEVKAARDSPDAATQRPHRFNTHTFTGLHWCGVCGHFLWGFVSQGVRCQDCNLKAHRQCSAKVPNDCCPDLKDLNSIFGADLTTTYGSGEVPGVVAECVGEVEARGLTMEGIYRVPGSQEQIEALRLAFERDGNRVNLTEKAVPDVNVVAGVLKLYLRLLPLPLVTAHCFTLLQAACKLSNPEAKMSGLREALHTLPPTHLATLRAIVLHLARVCEHSAVNKMTATSLSTVFAPTLIQSATPGEHVQPADLLALSHAQEPRVLEVLLVHHRDIFL